MDVLQKGGGQKFLDVLQRGGRKFLDVSKRGAKNFAPPIFSDFLGVNKYALEKLPYFPENKPMGQKNENAKNSGMGLFSRQKYMPRK